MKRSLSGMFIGLAAVCLMASRTAQGSTTNVWQDDAGNYSGDFTNTVHWDTAASLTTTTVVRFANNQTTPYTVTFTTSVSNDALQVTSDKVTFDLSGFTWTCKPSVTSYGGGEGSGDTWISPTAGQTSIVTFLTTAPGSNIADLGYGGWDFNVGNGATIDILSNVTVQVPYRFKNKGKITVDGSTLTSLHPAAGTFLGGEVLVRNGGTLDVAGLFVGNHALLTTGGDVILSNSTARAKVVAVGTGWGSSLALYDGSSLAVTGTITLGVDYNRIEAAANYIGELMVDNSTLDGDRIVIGVGPGGSFPTVNGIATIQNGANATLTNGVTVKAGGYNAYTNALVLNNGTITLGSGPTAGALTNGGVMRAAGTIRGGGASQALVRNENTLTIGSSIGTLVLSNANLELAAGSTTILEFDPTLPAGGDLIDVQGGSATIASGALVFSNLTGATAIGFGDWDFLKASSIAYNATSDNLSNLVSSLSMPTLAQGFAGWSYGVVNVGGYDVLRLSITMIPEPSTALLWLGGGLLLWLVRGKKRTQRA